MGMEDALGDQAAETRGGWTGGSWASPSLSTVVGWMPLRSMALAADGSLLAANGKWEAWAQAAGAVVWGEGWLELVDPSDREALAARLRRAAAARQHGGADCRLADPQGRRWSRWWWQPGPAGALVVSIADVDDDVARGFDAWRNAPDGPGSGLVSQGQFMDRLGRAIRRHQRGTLVVVVLASLDIAAGASDGRHRLAGAQLLRAAARRILDVIRPGDAAARVGSDQLAIVRAGLTDASEADALAAQVREAADVSADIGGVMWPVSAATGVAVTSARGEPATMLLARARQAITAARRRPGGEQPTGGGAAEAPPAAGGMDALAAGRPPAHPERYQRAVVELSSVMVNRISAAGLSLASAASVLDRPAAARVQQAADELDTLIRDVRTIAFGLLPPPHLTAEPD